MLPAYLTFAQPIGSGQVRIVGLGVDIDTRPDLEGIQSTRTAVKGFPAAVLVVVGDHSVALPDLPADALVMAELSGPGLSGTTLTLAARPGAFMEIPALRIAGDYLLSNVRLVSNGEVILRRLQGPDVAPIVINVIDEILVTEVTSRPLSLDEIQERGIVITEDNFSAFDFVVGFLVESEPVRINFPVIIPTDQDIEFVDAPRPKVLGIRPAAPIQIPGLEIPNLMISGFGLSGIPPDEPETKEVPPTIPGVIIIPGDVGFLNEFFSVLLMVSNVAPEGSTLVVENLRAEMKLPPGADSLFGTGDDPLRVAETTQGGAQTILPIVRIIETATGETVLAPAEDFVEAGDTGQAEFLLEGLKEGTHVFDIDIAGDLTGFQSGNSYPLSTTVPGSVLVRNPNFAMTIAHPEVVRDQEPYTLFVTATNTAEVDANLFSLRLKSRSLSGTHLASGEDDVRSMEVLKAGETETFAFRMVSETTGKITASVFVSDEGINGRFLLTVGVSEEGVPLSPDTLILPTFIEYLPDEAVRASMRLLGQAYSVATAPGGSLTSDIARMSKVIIGQRAVDLVEAGLRLKFEEATPRVLRDLIFDILGADVIDAGEIPGRVNDIKAFDTLRRATVAGEILGDTFAQLLAPEVTDRGIIQFQRDYAETVRYRPPHFSLAIGSGNGPAPVQVLITDAEGRGLGSLVEDDSVRKEIPYAEVLVFDETPSGISTLSLIPVADSTSYQIEFVGTGSGTLDLGLVVPDGTTGQRRLTFEGLLIRDGDAGTITVQTDAVDPFLLSMDTDGDGIPEAIAPTVNELLLDEGPRVLKVRHWGQGTFPFSPPKLDNGDPLGRLVAVLFSEPLDQVSAEDPANYDIDGHRLGIVSLLPESRTASIVKGAGDSAQVTSVPVQPRGRIAMIFLREPMRPPPDPPVNSPFIPRTLTLNGLLDLRANPMDPTPQTFDIAPEPAIGTGAVISGTIRHADGTPVPFALVNYIQLVCVFPICPSPIIISQLTADARGEYFIDFVLQDGYGPFTIEAQDPATGDSGRVTTSIQFDGQHSILDVIIPGFGSVEGTVWDVNHTPVPGAIVNVSGLNPNTSFKSGVAADTNGRYRIERVPVGNIGVEAVNPADGTTGRAAGNIPTVGTTAIVDINLFTFSGSVRGRVLQSDGVTPVARIPVVLTVGSKSIALEKTDASGQVLFEGIPVGSFELAATNLVTGEVAKLIGTVEADTLKDFSQVFPGSGAGIQGMVLDGNLDPVEGAQVVAGLFLTETDMNGSFEISGLVVGNVKVTAGDPATGTRTETTVTLTSPSDVQEVTLVLPSPTAGVNITGTIFMADRITPIPYAPVYFIAGGVAVTEADEFGIYRFDNLPVQLPLDAIIRSTQGTFDGGETKTRFLFDGETRNLDIIYRGRGNITGRVVQAQGATPVIADVIITKPVIKILKASGGGLSINSAEVRDALRDLAGSSGLPAGVQGILDAAVAEFSPADEVPVFGVQEVELKSDEVIQVTLPDGQAASEPTGGFTLNNVLAGPFSVSASNAFLGAAKVSGTIPKTLNPTARDIDVGDLILDTATGSVEGIVFLPDGKTPVGANVGLTIRSAGLPEFSVITDENGRYEFPLVPLDTFKILADTGVPINPALTGDAIVTDRFADLNIRLFGETMGHIDRGGDQVTADVRLLDASGVRIKVVANDGASPVPFARVTLKTTSMLDEDDFVNLNTDVNGEIELFPVIAGDFAIEAREPNTAAVGLASGTISANPLNGFVLPITVQLGSVTTPEGISAVLGFGRVIGTIFDTGVDPISNPTEVILTIRRKLKLTTTSDSNGQFGFEAVPTENFSIEVFEPFTARRGGSVGEITVDGETVVADVTLEGLGTVIGSVLSFDGLTAQPASTVRLIPAGNFSTPIVSDTDINGRFSFPGVSVGPFTATATEPTNGLIGVTAGEVIAEGEIAKADIFLEASGTVRGTIFGNNGMPVSGATVALRRGNFVIPAQADSNGVYSVSNVPVGEYTVTARPPTGTGGGTAPLSMTIDKILAGTPVSLDLTFVATGTVEGRIVDSNGATPVEQARVTLISSSPFLVQPQVQSTDSNGRFSFPETPAGEFSLTVMTTLEPVALGTAVSGTVPSPGVDLGDIFLQDSGTIEGCVLRPDGATPAAEAFVVVSNSTFRLSGNTDAAGCFLFEGLPLSSYTVSLLDPVSTGRGAFPVALTFNGQTIDLATRVLDNQRPAVVAISPADGSAKVDPNVPITITLSELIDPVTVTDKTFKVTTPAGTVPGVMVVSNMAPTITFQADDPLPDLTVVTVSLSAERVLFNQTIPGIKDAAGYSLLDDVIVSFVTRDSTPPVTTSLSPRRNAVEIPVQSVIRVEFDEPIDRSSIVAFTLNDGLNTISGELNTLPILNDTVVVFTPGGPLEPNQTYTVTIQGPIADRAGNLQIEDEVTWNFSTIDTIGPPVVALTSLGGTTLFKGTTARIKADVGNAADVEFVDFFINGVLLKQIGQAPFEADLDLAPTLDSVVTIGARATDMAGNIGNFENVSLTIVSDQPPITVISDPLSGTMVASGQQVDVVVRAIDDIGVQEIAFSASGAVLASDLERIAPAATPVEQSFNFIVPAFAPPGSIISLMVSARDTSGQSGPIVTRELIVADDTVPTVNITAPATGSLVDGGDQILVKVTALDNGHLSMIALKTSGVLSSLETRSVPPSFSASEVFTIDIPATVLPSETIIIEAQATDKAVPGNTGNATSVVLVVRDNALPEITDFRTETGALTAGIGQDIDLIVEATDNVGVRRVTLTATAGTVSPSSRAFSPENPVIASSFTLSVPDDVALVDSAVTLTAWISDAAGNQSDPPATLSVAIVDPIAPTVSIDSPATNTRVDPGEVVTVAISAGDNIGVTELALQVTGSASFQETVAIPAELVTSQSFQFTVPAAAAAHAPINVTATARDEALNEVSAFITLRVADVVPPAVMLIAPADGAGGVAARPTIQATFSETLDSITVNGTTVTLAPEGGAPVAAQVMLSADGRTITLVLDDDLAFATRHSLVLASDITDLAGNGLLSGVISTFTTVSPDITPPRVQSSLPVDGATAVSFSTYIQIVFSETVSTATINESSFKVSAGGTHISGGFSFYNGNSAVRYTPDVPLPFDTLITIELTADITDTAGNALADANGVPLTQPLTLTFTTGGFAISNPSDGGDVIENTAIMIEARGSGPLNIATVTFTVNGDTSPPVSGPLFTLDYAAPEAAAAPALSIIAVARNSSGTEVARDQVTVNVVIGLRIEPQLMGIPLGETGSLRLFISSPLASDLTVDLSSADPAVASVPAAEVLTAGQTERQVDVSGTGSGSTTILANSSRGTAAAIVSVDEPLTGQLLTARAPIAGVALLAPPWLGQIVLAENSGRTVSVRLLDSPAPNDIPLLVTSSNAAVAGVQGTPTILAGTQIVELSITTGQAGTADLGLKTGTLTRRFTVIVGTPAAGSVPPVFAAPVGVAVIQPPWIGQVILAESGAQTITVRVLDSPAAENMDLTATSSNTGIADVQGAVTILAGSQSADLAITTGHAGTAVLTLQAGSVIRTFTVIVGTPAAGSVPPVFAAPVGVAVIQPPWIGQVILPANGAQTVTVRLIDSSAGNDAPVTITSSDISVAHVPNPVTILAGTRVADLAIVTGQAGTAILTLQSGSVISTFTVIVGTSVAGSVPPVFAAPVGMAVLKPGTAGTLFLDTGGSRLIDLRLLSAPAAFDISVQADSDDSQVANITPADLTLFAGQQEASFTVDAGDNDAETLIILKIGADIRNLRVIVGIPPESDAPLTTAPIVGVDVAE